MDILQEQQGEPRKQGLKVHGVGTESAVPLFTPLLRCRKKTLQTGLEGPPASPGAAGLHQEWLVFHFWGHFEVAEPPCEPWPWDLARWQERGIPRSLFLPWMAHHMFSAEYLQGSSLQTPLWLLAASRFSPKSTSQAVCLA